MHPYLLCHILHIDMIVILFLQEWSGHSILAGMEWSHSILAGMEWGHSIPAGMELTLHSGQNRMSIPFLQKWNDFIPFLQEWNDLIPFQSKWNEPSIPAGME